MRSESVHVLRWWSRAAVSALAVCAVGGLSGVARADEAQRAVWQVQEVQVPYFGLTTYYTCDGFRDRMRSVMRRLEVREDFLVSVTGCTETNRPEQNLSATVIFAHAVPATDEATKAFASDPKRAQLLAKLQKRAKTPTMDAPFDAVKKRVALHVKERGSATSAGDCELIEQVGRVLIPKLGAKVIKDEVNCAPGQGIVGNPKLEVEVLVPVKPTK